MFIGLYNVRTSLDFCPTIKAVIYFEFSPIRYALPNDINKSDLGSE